MTAQLITEGAVAALLFPEDDASPGGVRAVVASLLRGAGLDVWPDMEIELFPAAGETLLMARPAARLSCVWCFAGPEELIGAALACGDMPSQLVTLDGRYYLLTGPDADARLREFSLAEPGGGELAAHLREHGRVLIERGAAARLRSAFCGGRDIKAYRL